MTDFVTKHLGLAVYLACRKWRTGRLAHLGERRDAVQEAFLALCAAAPYYNPDRPEASAHGLASLAIQRHLNKLVKKEVPPLINNIHCLHQLATVECDPTNVVLYHEVLRSMKGLQKVFRIVLEARCNGVPRRRIAEQLGVTTRTVNDYYRQAIVRLRRVTNAADDGRTE